MVLLDATLCHRLPCHRLGCEKVGGFIFTGVMAGKWEQLANLCVWIEMNTTTLSPEGWLMLRLKKVPT